MTNTCLQPSVCMLTHALSLAYFLFSLHQGFTSNHYIRSSLVSVMVLGVGVISQQSVRIHINGTVVYRTFGGHFTTRNQCVCLEDAGIWSSSKVSYHKGLNNALFSSPLQDVYMVYNTQAHNRAKMGVCASLLRLTDASACAVDAQKCADAELHKMIHRLQCVPEVDALQMCKTPR